MRYCFFCLIVIIITASCTPTPKIQVSDTLETGLGDRYSKYVIKLNAAVSGDTNALEDVLLYDKLDDGAAYEHGWVIIQLMRKVGDHSFAKALQKLNRNQLENVRLYFIGGLDIHTKADQIRDRYPKSFDLLKI